MAFTSLGIHDAADARLRVAANPLADRLRLGSLWLIGASSGFVMIEPAPYEFFIVLSLVVFAATGLTLRVGHLPLMFLLIFYNIGFATSLVPVVTLEGTAIWTAVSCFLSLTTFFFAVALAEDTVRRTDALLSGYIFSAVITSVIAVLAYFKLIPGWEMFIGALRARATFKDPNVFAPFLILPALIILQRIMIGGSKGFLRNAAMALIIAAGLFLSFSRGAWGHFGASALVMLFLTYVTTRSNVERTRVVIVAVLFALLIAAFVLALLSLDQVADLFKERAALVQDYDAGHTGRFGRHILGALIVLDHPMGIGPLQFSKYLPEDPHNSFLDAFVAGGWLGGFAFLLLVVLTLWVGLRQVFIRTPWQPLAIAAYAALVGEVGESYIIDVQHWRHYYLIFGLVWALVLARRPATPRKLDNAMRNADAPAC
jgi:hypothetical protein